MHYLIYLSRGTTPFAKLKTRWPNWNVTRLSGANWDTNERPPTSGAGLRHLTAPYISERNPLISRPARIHWPQLRRSSPYGSCPHPDFMVFRLNDTRSPSLLSTRSFANCKRWSLATERRFPDPLIRRFQRNLFAISGTLPRILLGQFAEVRFIPAKRYPSANIYIRTGIRTNHRLYIRSGPA